MNTQQHTKIATILPTPSHPGYNNLGWFTDETAGDLIGQPSNSYTPTADIRAYAQWTEDEVYSYTLRYDANGGTDNPAVQSYLSVENLEEYTFIVSDAEPVRPYAVFLGWATTSSATDSEYSGGDEITVATDETVTLYAVWEGQGFMFNLLGWIPLFFALGILLGITTLYIIRRR